MGSAHLGGGKAVPAKLNNVSSYECDIFILQLRLTQTSAVPITVYAASQCWAEYTVMHRCIWGVLTTRSRLLWHTTLQPSNSEHMMQTQTIASVTMNKSCCISMRSVSPAAALAKSVLHLLTCVLR